jgi:hypothetical protein
MRRTAGGPGCGGLPVVREARPGSEAALIGNGRLHSRRMAGGCRSGGRLTAMGFLPSDAEPQLLALPDSVADAGA